MLAEFFIIAPTYFGDMCAQLLLANDFFLKGVFQSLIIIAKISQK